MFIPVYCNYRFRFTTRPGVELGYTIYLTLAQAVARQQWIEYTKGYACSITNLWLTTAQQLARS